MVEPEPSRAMTSELAAAAHRTKRQVAWALPADSVPALDRAP